MIPTRRQASLAARPWLRPLVGLQSYPASRSTALLAVQHRPGLVNYRQPLPHQWGAKAWESTDTAKEEKETGQFDVKSNESLFFFDNIFPLKIIMLMRWPIVRDRDPSDILRKYDTSSLGVIDPIQLIKTAIPDDMALKVTEIMPQLKDGGAFVKVQHDATISSSEIEETLCSKLEEHPLKPWFNPFRGIKARLVRGSPWLEDLYRFPSNIIKVEFVPPDPASSPAQLSEEYLYSVFRRYGKIADINPQPADSKELPRYVHIGYPSTRDAIMARNCLHGLLVPEAKGGGKAGTLLRLSYVKRVKAHSIWNWLTSHPRIVIPILAALIAGASVVIFEPIRQMFIKIHIQHSWSLADSRLWKWFKTQTSGFSFSGKKEKSNGLSTVWSHRRELIDQLHSWLDGSSDTFIVVTGPRGSGKVEMVMDQSLAGRSNVLKLDCRPIAEARGEAGIIRRLAAAVGYRPIFSWANNLSGMIDLAVQSTTGVKAGFSETFEAQVVKILHTTAAALKDVSLSARHKKDKDADLSEDAWLEAHPELRPVVVIDNFLHKGEEKTIVYEKIAEWAASLVQNNVAHVVFLTSDTSYTKPLAKALPDRVFRSLSLGDLEHGVAKNFIISRIEDDVRHESKGENNNEEETKPAARPDLTGLDECIYHMGGRLTDLEFLARRLKAGLTPRQALDEIVNESATDIVKIYLLGRDGDAEKKWSTQQAWYLVKALADQPHLRYNQVLLSPTFASSTTASANNGETALESLAASELISISSYQGRPHLVKVGKPLHQAAFSTLIRDRVLKAKMDLAVLDELAKVEAKTIDKAENELSLLGSLPRQTGESAGRITYLMAKLDGSQRKIVQLEREMALLKQVLNEEY